MENKGTYAVERANIRGDAVERLGTVASSITSGRRLYDQSVKHATIIQPNSRGQQHLKLSQCIPSEKEKSNNGQSNNPNGDVSVNGVRRHDKISSLIYLRTLYRHQNPLRTLWVPTYSDFTHLYLLLHTSI
jgi:hypothetical protein